MNLNHINRSLSDLEAQLRCALEDELELSEASLEGLRELLQRVRTVQGLARTLHEHSSARGQIASAFTELYAASTMQRSPGSFEPMPTGIEVTSLDGLLWARQQLLLGRPLASLEPFFKELDRTFSNMDNDQLQARAGIVWGMWLSLQSRHDEALKLLQKVEPTQEGERALMDVGMAHCLVKLGRLTEAQELLRRAWSQRESLPTTYQRELALQITQTMINTGDLVGARSALDYASSIAFVDPRSRYNEHLRVLRAHLAMAAQDHRTFDELSVHSPAINEISSNAFAMEQLQHLYSTLFKCRLEQFDELDAQMTWAIRMNHAPAMFEGWRELARLTRDVMLEPKLTLFRTPSEPLSSATQRAHWTLWCARAALMSGDSVQMDTVRATREEGGSALPLGYAVEVEWSLIKGDAARALELARAGAEIAADLGYLGPALELEIYQAIAKYVSHPTASCKEDLTALGARAVKLGSDRLRLFATLATALMHDTRDIRVVADVANQEHHAPLAAQIARAVLSGSREHGHELALALARYLTDHTLINAVCEGEPDREVWGVDARSCVIWRASGKQIDLRRRPLVLRLLHALAQNVRGCTKETLVLHGWGRDTYDPNYDDNRLHVTINRLRATLEDEPSSPMFILTTETGYRLNPRHAFWWID